VPDSVWAAGVGAGVRRPQLLQLVLYGIALHSFLTGIGLLLQPDFLIAWGGWAEVTEPFFPAQGGIFHILMALLYAKAARPGPERQWLLSFIVIVKITAAVFLLGYFFLVHPIWVVLVSGVLDGAMALTLVALRNSWSASSPVK